MTLGAHITVGPDPVEQAVTSALAAGDLPAALAAAKQGVRKHATSAVARERLMNLCLLTGDFTAAAKHAETVGQLDPKRKMEAAGWLAGCGCENRRADVYAGKASPLILGEPDDATCKAVAGVEALARGDADAASGVLADARESAGGDIRGTITFDTGPDEETTEAFTDFADADGRLGPILELFVDGRYSWLPPGRVAELRLQRPETLRDLVWQPAGVRWTNGGTAGRFCRFDISRFPIPRKTMPPTCCRRD